MEEVYKTCVICGSKFAGAIQAKYCPECKCQRKLESLRKHYANKKNGTAKKIGEMFPCELCGKPIVRKSASHKYCEECAIKRKLKEITCAGCGKLIIRQFSGQKYCDDCRNNSKIRAKHKSSETIICAKCGEITIKKAPNQKYCDDCAGNKNPMVTEMTCEICGKTAVRKSWNQKYCDDCRKKKIKFDIGEAMECEICGKPITRKSASHLFCEECSKKRIKDNIKNNTLKYYAREKENIEQAKKTEMSLYDAVSDERPLNINIKEIFQEQFAQNIGILLKTVPAKEISELTGKTAGTVYGWSYKASVPPIKILLQLYRKFGDQMLPCITHDGVLQRKDSVSATNDKPISKMCAKAGYTIPQAAKALNKSVVNFRLVYGKDNFGDNAAIELLYVFGIDDVLEFFG